MRKFLILLAISLLGAVVAPAGPASAHPEHRDWIQWRSPDDGQRVSGQDVHIRARLSFGNDGVRRWAVEILAPMGTDHPGFGTICEESVGGQPLHVDIDCRWDTTWYPADGTVSENRRYIIRITGYNAQRSMFSPSPEAHVAEREAVVVNPVTAPRNVTLSFSEPGKQATVRWAQNPEPDIARYVIQERFGSEGWKTVGTAGNHLTSFSRRLSAPGTYRYQVAALRPAGTEEALVQSSYSGPAQEPREIVVKPPPTTTTTRPPARAAGPDDEPDAGGAREPDAAGTPVPVPAGGTGTPTPDPEAPPAEAGAQEPGSGSPDGRSAAGAPPGDPRGPLVTRIQPGSPGSVGTQRSFGGNVRNPPPPPAPAPQAPVEDDAPFSETLPYPTQSPSGADDDAGMDEALATLPDAATGDDRRAQIIPLAAGLLLFIFAMHAFYLSRRAREQPLEKAE